MSVAARWATASAWTRFRSAASAFLTALIRPRSSRSASTAASPVRFAWSWIVASSRRTSSIEAPTRWISASASGVRNPWVTIARSINLVRSSSAGGIVSRRPNQGLRVAPRTPAFNSSREIGRKSPGSAPSDLAGWAVGIEAGSSGVGVKAVVSEDRVGAEGPGSGVGVADRESSGWGSTPPRTRRTRSRKKPMHDVPGFRRGPGGGPSSPRRRSRLSSTLAGLSNRNRPAGTATPSSPPGRRPPDLSKTNPILRFSPG